MFIRNDISFPDTNTRTVCPLLYYDDRTMFCRADCLTDITTRSLRFS